MSVCHYCFGLGYIPEEGYDDCPYCDGTGYVDDVDDDDAKGAEQND
jgi:RecJ-like exonuclease